MSDTRKTAAFGPVSLLETRQRHKLIRHFARGCGLKLAL
jgi:hypothetical protein